MLTILHQLAGRRGVLAIGLLVLPLRLGAQARCSSSAAAAVTRGWVAYRADSIERAAQEFIRAAELCPRSLDAVVGLGYTAYRLQQIARADSLFRAALRGDSANADAWEGLALATFRAGAQDTARVAARRALGRNPKSQDARRILDALDPDWDRPALAPPSRPAVLQLTARTRGERFEIRSKSGWKPFYIRGVNLGVALPGRFPSDFPTDSSVYAGWLDTLSAMHANLVRLYTILPPAFYRALAGWNRTHQDRPIRLMHGVWTELPPGQDFQDAAWKGEFQAEMRRVADLIHGAAEIPRRPGHAGGRYDADVSRWTLAYIIGREWEPFAVEAFDAAQPGPAAYRGRYLELRDGTATDAWMAEQCDYLLEYEVGRFNALRPIAYTSWPTLDPLYHPTETTVKEEQAWRRRLGLKEATPSREYNNDAVALDASLIRPTERNPAGWFASYHAYPYYPDFMLYDPGYSSAASTEGRSNYFGYLQDLHRHHAGMPVVISEYGVPSSRGTAHLQPQGWDHGGHSEIAMAGIDARLTREIREAGLAGGILFAWLDEWFKKNWIVIDREIPPERTRLWHNLSDAEQNYGILGLYAGDDSTTPLPGGDPARWLALAVQQGVDHPPAGAPRSLRIGQDESYLYLAIDLMSGPGAGFPWDSLGLRVALDTYRSDLGQQRLPPGSPDSDLGFEFLVELNSPDDAELRIVPDYNPYAGADAIIGGDDAGRFARRPITIRPRQDGQFDSLFVITNRTRITRDGHLIPATGYNRGRLHYGRAMLNSLADWYYDQAAGLLELRIPWDLLNVSDPSSRTLLYEAQATGDRGTVQSDGFRIGAWSYRKGPAPTLVGAVPAPDHSGRWVREAFTTWTWTGWEAPRYHQRLKPVYDSLRALWGKEKE